MEASGSFAVFRSYQRTFKILWHIDGDISLSREVNFYRKRICL